MERTACQASCSYTLQAATVSRASRRRHLHTTAAPANWGLNIWKEAPRQQHERRRVLCEGQKPEHIQGYTPANYISYTSAEQHRCHHIVAVEVDAPANVCFDIWNDWNQLVEFLDLVSQIGLDPEEPDKGLFQCFYRWGRLPVMEIVFLARKTEVERDKRIAFDTIWGMPAQGEVTFIEDGNSTLVLFKLEHQMPWLLLDMRVGVLGLEISLREILNENMQDFKEYAESVAKAAATASSTTASQEGSGQGTVAGQEGNAEVTADSQQQQQGTGASEAPRSKPRARSRSSSRAASAAPASKPQQQPQQEPQQQASEEQQDVREGLRGKMLESKPAAGTGRKRAASAKPSGGASTGSSSSGQGKGRQARSPSPARAL